VRRNVLNRTGEPRIRCLLPDGDQRHGQRPSATSLQAEEREEEAKAEAMPQTSKPPPPPP